MEQAQDTSIEKPKSIKPNLRVLFVSSGNVKNFDVVPFIRVQGESLAKENVEVDFFKIRGKGIMGYLKNIRELRKYILKHQVDIIHAHFTLSGWVAVLSFTGKPIVLSLMGTDAFGKINKVSNKNINNKNYTFLTYGIQPFVDKIICKSANIQRYVWQKSKSTILPNGVDLDVFDGKRTSFRLELGLDPEKKYLLFLGNPDDTNKNFSLVKSIENELNTMGITLINPYPISHQLVPKYLSSVDLFALCSFQEGSPNVVKECMASNCRGVFTPVGDVEDLVIDVEGYRVADWDPKNFLKAIIAVAESDNVNGRKAIKDRGLDISTIAKRLREIYDRILEKK
jgi:teichuronic acid biosynthesis glycosyltransferase TuaC